MGIRTMIDALGYIKIIYTPQGVHNTLIFNEIACRYDTI